MIVNDHHSYFEMIPQHEHARISYEIIKNWGDTSIEESPFWDALLLAVREHDSAWIPLDASPKLNRENNKPFSFIDYPEKEKMAAYQHGIQTVADKNPYSGMLNSLHYASFYKHNKSKEAAAFLQEETARQAKLRKSLHPLPEEEFHLKLLQFCDDLSLYVSMNNPGTTKEEEVNWFKNGFRHTFDFLDYRTIQPRFKSKEQVELCPFPLRSSLEVSINGISVSKKKIEEKSLLSAFETGESTERKFTFVP
ncbi:DUF3891 family protein [Alteribacillus sp. JSM 102045]|uniref:DUF3891 family protein n=1 Tax=Alteribacillus sp. JSM 102045 TaxID=1562101 RepID=UPI0035C0C2B2